MLAQVTSLCRALKPILPIALLPQASQGRKFATNLAAALMEAEDLIVLGEADPIVNHVGLQISLLQLLLEVVSLLVLQCQT